MKKTLIACTSTVAVVLCAAAIALACRVIEEKRPQDRPASTVTHKDFKVDVQITDQVATVTVQPTFTNPHDWPVEGIYFLSLPAGAQVKDFAMTVNGKEHKAELLDTGKARQAYTTLMQQQRDPALLELVGSQMMRMSIGSIAAKTDVAVKVVYTTLLENTAGLVALDIPFTNQFGGDYAIPQISVNVAIASKVAIKNVYSPTHSIDAVKKDDRSLRISYEAKNYTARKAFKLFYALSDDEVGINLLTFRPQGEDGFFLLMASPKVEVAKDRILPKDIVFVMDRSGSMAGDKIRQAREALVQALEFLNPKDRFNIVDFSSEATTFDKELVEATNESRARANRYVEGIKAAGSTNIMDAIETALAVLPRDPARMSMILFATDGLPTVGDQNMQSILQKALAKNPAGAGQIRIFVMGVGNDVNTQFLDKLAEDHHGARDYVAPEEKIEVKVAALMEKISSPVLGNLSIELTNGKLKDIYPRSLPDLFKGQQLVVFGRFEGSGPTTLTVKGLAAGEQKTLRFDVNLPEKDVRHDFIPRLWAARKVAYLADQIRLGGNASQEIVDEIVMLGKKYGIVTAYTSFLITEDGTATGGAGGGGRRKAAAEELNKLKDKAADSGKGDGKVAPADAQGASKELKEGRDSADAESLEKQLEQARGFAKKAGGREAAQAMKTGVRVVGSKTFFGRNGIWTDSEFDAAKMKEVTKVKFMSDEYFKLMDEKAELAKFFALGDAVIVVWESKVYEVQPMTETK